MGEHHRRSLRHTHLAPEAGGPSQEGPEDGKLREPGEAVPGPGDPEEVPPKGLAAEWHPGSLDPKEVLLEPEPALEQALEVDTTMRWVLGPGPGRVGWVASAPVEDNLRKERFILAHGL